MKLTDIILLKEDVSQAEVSAFAERVKQQLGLEEFDLRALKNNVIELELILVPRKMLGQGLGTKALELLTQFADSKGARLALQTAGKDKRKDWGTTSKDRLKRFYRRFGFVPNQGRYKDYTLSIYHNMYRNPKKNQL